MPIEENQRTQEKAEVTTESYNVIFLE